MSTPGQPPGSDPWTTHPSAPQQPPGHPQQWQAGPSPAAWAPAGPRPSGGRGLAITALVLSGLALLLATATALWTLLSWGSTWDGAGGWGPLTGQVQVADDGTVSGDVLARAIDEALTQDSYDVQSVSCPASVPVGPEEVVTCRSVADGFDWVEFVLFDDATGSFVLLRL
jgi:hypothetical protein